MSSDNAYNHYHEASSEWFQRSFLVYSSDSSAAHYHQIIDKSTGRTGEGYGRSYGEAELQARDNLNAKLERVGQR